MLWRKICAALLLALLAGCGNVRHAPATTVEDKIYEALSISMADAVKGKIIFLNFTATLVDSLRDGYQIRLLDKKIVDGTMKSKGFNEQIGIEPNNLYCKLLSSQKMPLQTLKTVDPLSRMYEHPGEAKDFEKTSVKQKTGEFGIRFMMDEKIKYISIFKPVGINDSLQLIYHAQF